MPQIGGLTTETYFLTVQEAGKSKVKVPVLSVSSEDSFPGLYTATFSLCPHQAGKGKRFNNDYKLAGISD